MSTFVTDPVLRPAVPADAVAIGRVWHAAWHDAHDAHVPEPLVAMRTEAAFQERAAALVPRCVVAERDGVLVGFTATYDDEVAELFVDQGSRGTGAARLLLLAAEHAVRRAGHPVACLGVVPGNTRARRFYEREGWRDAGDADHAVDGPDGPIAVATRLYLKDLRDDRHGCGADHPVPLTG